VEALAMNLATEFYSQSWDVEDVHGKESYDLVCRRGDEVSTSRSREPRPTGRR
jgi:hypothetical protein